MKDGHSFVWALAGVVGLVMAAGAQADTGPQQRLGVVYETTPPTVSRSYAPTGTK